MISRLDRLQGRDIYENTALAKINELVDAVNELQKHEEQHLDLLTQLNEMRLHQNKESAENVQPYYVTTSYTTDGHQKEYYGQNGASIATDYPLPAGYVITIREPEIKGGDNE